MVIMCQISHLCHVFLMALVVLLVSQLTPVYADWESWWTYEGISGPDFWGRLNPKWSHCSKGQRQSPIDIDPRWILYDPRLEPLVISGDLVGGQLQNTGRGISMAITDKAVVISGGPLSYHYTLSNITLHFGRDNSRGSEHSIAGRQYAGEVQLYAYNSNLYTNWTEAQREPNGIVAIAILLIVGKGGQGSQHANPALKHITSALKNITERGQSQTIGPISVLAMLPGSTRQFVTYEGSLTQPACHETVQWIILNRPLHLSPYQFHMLRHSLKGDGHQDNFRPTQPLNRRVLRSNIANTDLPNYHQSNEVPVESGNAKSEVDLAESSAINDDPLQLMAGVKDGICSSGQLHLYGYQANKRLHDEM